MNWSLRQIFERVTGRTSTDLRVVFANRTVWQVLQGEPDVSIAFHTMSAECRTVLLGYVWFFEAYFDGDVDIEGERAVGRLMRMAFAGAYHYRANPLLLAKRRYLEWCNNNQDFARAKANAIHHYGVPFEFFRLMLCRPPPSPPPPPGLRVGAPACGRCSRIAGTAPRPASSRHRASNPPHRDSVAKRMLAAAKYGAEVVNYGLVPEQNRVMQERLDQRGWPKGSTSSSEIIAI